MKQSKENIYSLNGFSKVYRFTIVQMLKNKGFIISGILMILMMSCMKPFSYLMSKSSIEGANSAFTAGLDSIEADNMIVLNETGVALSNIDFPPSSKELTEGNLHAGNILVLDPGEKTVEELIASLSDRDLLVVINTDVKGYRVNVIISDDSKVSMKSQDKAGDYVTSAFDEARKNQMKLDQTTLGSISAGVSTGDVITEKDFQEIDKDALPDAQYQSMLMGFGMILVIVLSLGSTYIIVSVNEEKQSKLAESLLVTVRPMALLMGKVLGILSYVVSVIILGVLGATAVDRIMTDVAKIDMSGLGQAGINFSIFTDYGVKGFFVFLVEVLLSLLAFGLMSGLFGSACGSTEEQQNATSISAMLIFVGYFGAIYGGINADFSKIASLIPPLAYFVAPSAYVAGRIELPIFLISMVIQFAALAGIGMLAAKAYRNLLLSDSSKPKLQTIFAAAKM